MVDINVGYGEVQAASNRMKSAHQSMIDQVQQLKSMIENLVGSGFKTQLASGKFHSSYQQWDTGAKNVLDGLAGMSTFLDQVVAKHQELDSQLGSQIGG
ncbi:MAG TPA: WXG100 family type VII secretion target [Kineosporiaceae bacterium]|nr:WXG100 family type VII secretion target [Kineosporiaceae bacterium]